MMPHGFSRVGIAGLVLLLVASVVLSWLGARIQSEFTAEARDVTACRKLVSEIISLREIPQFAVLEAESVETIFSDIQRAVESAPLPPNALLRIQPSEPFYLSGSSYRIRPIRLELKDVTLQQIVSFARGLIDENRGLTVRDLEFWDSDDDSSGTAVETWSAELTLTQLIFSPMTRQSATRS